MLATQASADPVFFHSGQALMGRRDVSRFVFRRIVVVHAYGRVTRNRRGMLSLAETCFAKSRQDLAAGGLVQMYLLTRTPAS